MSFIKKLQESLGEDIQVSSEVSDGGYWTIITAEWTTSNEPHSATVCIANEHIANQLVSVKTVKNQILLTRKIRDKGNNP